MKSDIVSAMFSAMHIRSSQRKRERLSTPETARVASRPESNLKDLDASLNGRVNASEITAKVLAAWQNSGNATMEMLMRALKGSPEYEMLALALNLISEKLIIPLKKVLEAYIFWLLNKNGGAASGLAAPELDKVEKEALFDLFDRYLS